MSIFQRVELKDHEIPEFPCDLFTPGQEQTITLAIDKNGRIIELTGDYVTIPMFEWSEKKAQEFKEQLMYRAGMMRKIATKDHCIEVYRHEADGEVRGFAIL
jgi:hypothetical protein